MARAANPTPPFEAIEALLNERKDRYRQLRSSGREHECRIIGAEGASAGLGLSTQLQAQPSPANANAHAPETIVSAASEDGKVSRHAMIRMLAAGYLLPLLAVSEADPLRTLHARSLCTMQALIFRFQIPRDAPCSTCRRTHSTWRAQ